MAVTLADVAREAGTSTAAVSMVLSGHYRGRVSEPKAKKIRETAQQLHYIRNELALGLRTANSRTIGLITEEVASTPYATAMIAAATNTARELGYLLILIETNGNPQTADEAIWDLTSRQVHAVAYASMYHRQIRCPQTASKNLIILDGYTTDPAVTAAVPDEVQGAYDAVNHLINLGHRRVAYLNDKNSVDAGPLRQKGTQLALQQAGLDLLPNNTKQVVTSDIAAVSQAARALLTQDQVPTALFCYNDATAIIAARTAHELGFSIPQDLSIIGFDNFTMLTELFTPALTTVQLPHAEMAKWTIKHLINGTAPEDGPQPAPGTALYRFNCPLILRGSTAPPRLQGHKAKTRPRKS